MEISDNEEQGYGGDGEQQRKWPSIEKQLTESKVIHGSELHKLILANQDFEMLRPEELSDKLRLPVWLRVYWRKQHPDAIYSGPSGGYPLVLRELYDWMKEHQDFPGFEIDNNQNQHNLKKEGGSHGK